MSELMFLDWFWSGKDVYFWLSLLGLWLVLFVGIFVIPKWESKEDWIHGLWMFIGLSFFPFLNIITVTLVVFLMIPVPFIVTCVCLYVIGVVVHKIYITKFPS
jgi:hypothetical protein